MIYSEKIQQSNGIKIIVHWQYEAKEHLVETLCQNQELAISFTKNVARKLFVEKIANFVKQKNWLYNSNPDLLHSFKIQKALEKLNFLIETLPGMTLDGICKSILIYRNELIVLLPGQKSKYYHHDTAVIHGIIQDCEKILQNQSLNIAS